MNTEQERAEFEVWRRKHYDYDDLTAFEIEFAFAAFQAGRAALQSQEYTAAMSTTILTDEQITDIIEDIAWPNEEVMQFGETVARTIEQAVLQSPEVQAWKRDAERYRWATALDDNAETLYSIVLSYGGDHAKINERVDAYRPRPTR